MSDETAARRTGLAVGAAAVALSAYAGALGLATGALALEDGLAHRLPFHSPVFGGLALVAVVAVPFTVLAAAAWRQSPRTSERSFGAGFLLAGWILVELAFIQSISFFHPLYLAVGAWFMFAGRDALDRFGQRRPAPPTTGPASLPPGSADLIPGSPPGVGSSSASGTRS
ncbi:MAG: hypothetical protein ACHQNA_00390 [Acidimicrobiales bacterium]